MSQSESSTTTPPPPSLVVLLLATTSSLFHACSLWFVLLDMNTVRYSSICVVTIPGWGNRMMLWSKWELWMLYPSQEKDTLCRWYLLLRAGTFKANVQNPNFEAGECKTKDRYPITMLSTSADWARGRSTSVTHQLEVMSPFGHLRVFQLTTGRLF